MRYKTCRQAAAILAVMTGTAFAQEEIGINPFAGIPLAVKEGETIFRSRCSGCHGLDAQGAIGPNLVAALNNGISEERLYLTVLKGVPGTSMPALMNPEKAEEETWKTVTYLISLRGPASNVALAKGPAANIAWEDILNGLKNPSRWLTYSGDPSGQRHSPLRQITPANVATLTTQWIFQTGTQGKFEASPIVIDGVIYITGPNNFAWAIDAKTGRQIWRYQRQLPADANHQCCGTVNRGFAVLGGRLFMATLDAHLVALDIRDGKTIWDSTLEDYRNGYTATGAPMVVGDNVIVGVAGGEYGIRGSIQAFDAASGKRVWQFHTVPAPGEPGGDSWSGDSWKRGGAPVWAPGSYDVETDTVFFGTGNPAPDYDGPLRLGDNLYSDSLLALDPKDGKLKWHFQFTPHDVHDWDSAHTPVIADLRIGGKLRKVVMVANRNGFFYTLDRVTGKFILAKPFVAQNWAREIDDNGRPVLTPGHEPTPRGTVTCPDLFGATNFMPTSFDPLLGLEFFTVRERCQIYSTFDEPYVPGQSYRRGGGSKAPVPEYGAVRAIDPATGNMRWEFRYDGIGFPGVLSTTSGLVFAGDAQGNLHALNSRTGKDLWSRQLGWSPDAYQSGTGIFAGPSSFMVGNRQYVLIPSGTILTAFALPEKP